MTIEEAIEILNNLELPIRTEQDYRKHLAVRLGIKALTWIYELRGIVKSLPPHKLPGETKSPLKVRGARAVMKEKNAA